jgi:multidrug efflux pump
VPCAFISGIVGQFFRQFALTIAASTLISTFNSLTLSPALAALLLKPKGHGRNGERPVPLPGVGIAALFGWAGWVLLAPRAAAWLSGRGVALEAAPWWALPAGAAVISFGIGWVLAGPINWILSHFFAGFEAAFRWGTRNYVRSVAGLLRVTPLVLVVYGGLLYLTNYGARFDLPMPEGYAPREVRIPGLATTPRGFIPSQDMGYALVNVQLPDSAALERTLAVMNRLEEIAHEVPGVKHTQTTTGQSLLLSAFGPNFGSMFVIMDDFAKRRSPELYGEAIIGKLRARFAQEVPEARVTVLGPPPVRGVGRAGGFKLMVEDRGDNSFQTLQEQAEGLARAGNELTVAGKKPLADLTSVFSAKVPQLFVDVNRKEAMIKRVDLGELFRTLQIYLGSLYVNDFNMFGRTWQVIAQADAPFRNTIEAVRRLKVRNADGKMVPVGSLAEVKEVNGPLVLTRYNMHTAAPVNGSAAPGVSSGEAIALMEQLAQKELLPSMATEWTELAYLELQAGNTAMIVFGFAVAMVFLVLAAQYESWALPLAVILVVPMCLLSAVAGVNLAGQDINIFTQIGFVVLVGLACKNAILIVEFARGQRRTGLSRREAALAACGLRLRPIVMTSLAFILGVIPLLVSHGAGAEMRRTLGTTVFSGMIGVTAFGVLLTPVFFVLIDWLASLSIFRSRAARWISSVLLGILALGYVRRLARWAIARRPRPRWLPSATRNGQVAASDVPSSNGHAPAGEPEPVGERTSS